jgi:putative membrane protein
MPEPEQDPRIYFAAERTFLAWIRTGIALMGFGFAIARFGLFMRELQATTHTGVYHPWGSPTTGVTLIVIGIVVNIYASLHYVTTIRQLTSGSWLPGKVSRAAISLAIVLSLLGVLMAVYLLLLH